MPQKGHNSYQRLFPQPASLCAGHQFVIPPSEIMDDGEPVVILNSEELKHLFPKHDIPVEDKPQSSLGQRLVPPKIRSKVILLGMKKGGTLVRERRTGIFCSSLN